MVRARKLVPFTDNAATINPSIAVNIFDLFYDSQEKISPWWSPRRDINLRELVKKSDHLSSAMGKVTSYVASTPIKIKAKDTRSERFVRKAEELTARLHTFSGDGFMRGFYHAFVKFLNDYYTCDNGAHCLIMGPGSANKPVTEAWGIYPLDSNRCTRTGNWEYPVVYRHLDNKKYKLHYTKVITMERLASTQAEMFNVGFSSVSSIVETILTLTGMEHYQQERVGSRSPNIIAQSSLPAEKIFEAFYQAEQMAMAKGFKHYNKMVVIGEVNKDERVEFKHVNDGADQFDYRMKIVLSMFTMSLAFGVGARLLWPNSDVGATKADAMIQNLQTRHSSPGQILSEFTNQLTLRYCPKGYEAAADYQDDEQRLLNGRISDLHSRARERDGKSGTFSMRTMRQQALKDGSITAEQFEFDELEDGRLPDGSEVLNLFVLDNPAMRELLNVDVDNPLLVDENDAETVLKAIERQIVVCRELIANARKREKERAIFAKHALIELKKLYAPETIVEEDPDEELPEENEENDEENSETDTD